MVPKVFEPLKFDCTYCFFVGLFLSVSLDSSPLDSGSFFTLKIEIMDYFCTAVYRGTPLGEWVYSQENQVSQFISMGVGWNNSLRKEVALL